MSYESFGRINQKRRTRAALKEAAAELISQGVSPTIPQAAAAAFVSRSTAYRYFPSQEGLIAEVLLDEVVRPELEAVFAAAHVSGTAADRLDSVIRADHALVTSHHQAFRTALRAMVVSSDDKSPDMPRRAGNRLRYLGDALAPLSKQLGARDMERLVTALAMCVGIESHLVTADICALPAQEAERVKRWAAGALLRAALADAGGSTDDREID